MPTKPRQPKRRPPPHTVVVDTNALWHEDKTFVVAPRFGEVWGELSALADLTLVIPEIVRAELVFQQTTSAVKSVEKATEQIDRLRAITGQRYGELPTPGKVRKLVEARFDRWVDEVRAVVVPTPISLVDWRRVVDAAVWRLPPFTFDSKDPSREKGFRDALILETLVAAIEDGVTPVSAFVCSDGLLRATAAERLKDDSGFGVYDSVEALGSHLRLLKEHLTEQYVKSLVSTAEVYFFVSSSPETLFYSAGVKELVMIKHAREFEVDEPFAGLFHHLSSDRPEPWKQAGGQRVRVSKPQFLEIQEPNVFVWRTPVTFVRAFHRSVPVNSIARAFGPAEHRVLIVQVAVDWEATVDAKGRHSKGAVRGTALLGREFAPATQALVTNYKLTALTKLDTWSRGLLT